MSKKALEAFDDGDVTEMFDLDPSRIDGVGQAANGTSFLLVKSVGSKFGRKLSPAARAAFARNAEAVRQGKRPRKGKADSKGLERGPDGTIMVPGPDRVARQQAAAERRSQKRAARAARVMAKAAEAARYSSEIPASGLDESASILTVVTGQSVGLCSARTASGLPCRRPAVHGGRCHLHK